MGEPRYSKELLEAQTSRSFLVTGRSSNSEDLPWLPDLMVLHHNSSVTALGDSSKSVRDHNRDTLYSALQSLDEDDFDVECLEVVTRSHTLVCLGLHFCFRWVRS